MNGAPHLSNALRITDVNDFLAPTTACILPLNGAAQPISSTSETVAVATITPAPPGSFLSPIVPIEAPVSGGKRAKVTVSDCLACSGCVTSAETVLLSTESLDTFRAFVSQSPQEKRNTFSIVALSQQAVASIGVHYGMSLLQTAGKLTAFLKNKLAIDAVVDLSLARHLSLLEAGEEFVERFRQGKLLTISSACPGWVTYAEKTQPSDVLNAISTVRSPQAIIGAIAEQLRPAGDNRQVWLTTIMPCHDKKLEASRPDFVTTHADNVNRKEVDCVMTTGELIDFIKQTSFSLTEAETLPFNKLNSASSPGQFGVAVGSGSGGYAEFILRKAAKELLGITLPDHPIITQKLSKSGDLKTATVSNEDGSKQLKFATAYGFRCLQSILRKVRRGECTYNYIELMACPGGCNNGGGQLPPKSISTEDQRSLKQQNNDHLAKVNATFSEAPVVKDPLVIPGVQKLYRDGLGGHPYSVEAKNQLTMPIQSRKNASGAASLSW